jgi:hypothetical protein
VSPNGVQSYIEFMEELEGVCGDGFGRNMDKEIERRRRIKDKKSKPEGDSCDEDEVVENEHEPDFGVPRRGQEGLAAIARSSPGALYRRTLITMAEHLQLRRADADLRPLRSRFGVYLNTVMIPAATVAHPLRMLREMRTIAFALDCLSRGEVLEACDILTQRFKALETSHEDGSWERASLAEVVPEQRGLLTQEERYRMSQQAAFERRLGSREDRPRGRGSPSPRRHE